MDFATTKRFILLYSKYTITSKRILAFIDRYNLGFIDKLCVDKADIKNVLRDNPYHLDKVPTLCLVRHNGTVDGYIWPRCEQLLQDYVQANNLGDERPETPRDPSTSSAVRTGHRASEGKLPTVPIPPRPIEEITTLSGLPIDGTAPPEIIAPPQLKPMDIDPTSGRVVGGGPPPVPKDPPTDKGKLMALAGMSGEAQQDPRGPSERSRNLMEAAKMMQQQRGL